MLRKSALVLIISLAIIVNTLNCGPQKEYDIKFDNITYDWGTRDEGINIEHIFTFTNTGKQDLVIQDVKPACGCTVADNWDKTVAPGKKGKIPITLKTVGYSGDITKTIAVTTNVPEMQTIQLTIKGKIRMPIAIIPVNVWLGEVNADSGTLSGSFEILNNLGVPVKLLEIVPPDDRTKFTMTTVEENKKYKVDFTIDPPFTGQEVIHGQFAVKTDNKKYEYIYP